MSLTPTSAEELWTPSTDEPDANAPTTARRADDQKDSRPQVTIGRPPIMVVDDDRDTRQSLSDEIEEQGYRVLCRRNGREALDALQAGLRPLLVLIDLSMPVMDGAEFRQAQLADPDLADVPAVLITGAVGQDGRTDFNEVLPKPLTRDSLLELLARYS